MKDTHELFAPSAKRGNESAGVMETETKGPTGRQTDGQKGTVGYYINSEKDDRHV